MARNKVWPALPKRLHGAGGPIRVRLVRSPTLEDGQECWGTWDSVKRLVSIAAEAPPYHQWRIFFHEMTHAAIDDAGLCHLLTNKTQETLCDAIASARMMERFGR